MRGFVLVALMGIEMELYVIFASAVVAFLAWLLVRGADEDRPMHFHDAAQEFSDASAAQAALDEYHAQIRAGGEPHYPQWAANYLRSTK